ncbi:DUF1353 domain-containing protein [Nitrosomonas communis]|uniref:DUF1353 domain-containing protein n=1 Tax=Nitrosomonas communis TaxID=44574 RepID=UPI0026F0FDD9|nr:DUF1353 domain-containing protein [Nitrosomonas communis]MCO6429036.1 DUF1353 domain-containing protein [Nitrosomonas communis]
MSEFAVKWIYVLDKDFSYNIAPYLPQEFSAGCAFEDRTGKRRLEIHPDGTMKVLADYAWDGCTPKFALWDILLGIPDGVPNYQTKKPKAYYASLLHDVLYQFLDADLPISRQSADKIFYELLKRDHFGPRYIYYAAVRIFGGIFRLITRWKRRYQGKKLPL